MRKPRLKLAWSALKLAFGGAARPVMALLVVLAIVSVGWVGDTLYAMAPGSPLWFVPLGLLFVMFVWGSRQAELIVPVVRQGPARPARAIVWFLSPPGPVPPEETDPEKMRSWRMAYEAIAWHRQRGELEHVIVIPSADSGSKRDGTSHYFEAFRRTMAKATGVSADCIRLAPDCRNGVNFESASELVQALAKVMEELSAQGLKDQDVVIDVTGGQKPPAVIGGIIGLGEGRRIQYVSTSDYDVIEYDITLE